MQGAFLNVFLTAVAMGAIRVGIDEYKTWKARRTEIPMTRGRDGVYHPDVGLKRFERAVKILAFTVPAVMIGGCAIFMLVAAGWLPKEMWEYSFGALDKLAS